MPMVWVAGCQWFATIGGLGHQRLRVLVPRPVGWGGELPDSGSTIGDEEQRPVPRLSYHASGTPPNVAENNNNMTIRRIYNKIHCIQVWTLPLPSTSRRARGTDKTRTFTDDQADGREEHPNERIPPLAANPRPTLSRTRLMVKHFFSPLTVLSLGSTLWTLS